MTTQDSSPYPPPEVEGPRAPRAVCIACYALLGLLLAWVLVQRYLRPLVLEESISVASSQPAAGRTASEAGPARSIDQRIDPNTAMWAELTRLPRIGESIAKRIVEYRESHRPTASGGAAGLPVFTSPEDLEQVRGIGRKTVEQIAPHLKFPASQPD